MSVINRTGFPRAIAAIAGLSFIAFGLMAMAAPKSFFTSLASFPPYNQHFIQDIGAFQLGLGAVLLLALSKRFDTLATALLGVGLGSAAHTLAHAIGTDLGGEPARDIATFALLTALILYAGWVQTKNTSP